MTSPDKFLKIVITSPDSVKDEAGRICTLLKNGIDYVHIRKPEATRNEIRDLIESIPYKFRRHLRLHGHFDLVNDYNLAGVHLNSRCPQAPQNALSVSKSCHSIEEANDAADYVYVTLSPIFDSISKEGYRSGYDLETIKRNLISKNVIALGGVTPDRFGTLRECGFAGAAMLGCVWNDFDRFIMDLNH